MKGIKKFTTAILVFALVLGVLPSISFADDEKTPFKVVAIGDSTCNGYGTDDCGYYSPTVLNGAEYLSDKKQVFDHRYNLGFLSNGSAKAYPALLADYIQETHPEYSVSFTNLGIAGARSDMFRYILEDNYVGDVSSRYEKNNVARIETVYKEEIAAYGASSLKKLYINEITSADVITLDVCLNNFTEYLGARLSDAVNGVEDSAYNETISDVIGTVSVETKVLIEKLKLKIKTTLGLKLPQNMVTKAVDAIAYCFADFCVNFSCIVSFIKELNPDVRVIVMGAYLPIDKLIVKYNGYNIEVATLLQAAIDAANTYVTSIDPNRFFYSYADIPQDVSTYFSYLKSCDDVWDVLADDLENGTNLVKRMVDMVFYDQMQYYNLSATEICNIIKENAQKDQVVIDTIDAKTAYEAILDVYNNGESCQATSKYIAEIFGKIVNLYVIGAKTEKIVPDDLGNAMNYYASDIILATLGKEENELTDADRTMLFILAIWQGMGGVGAHPDYQGCEEKFEAAKKAFDENKPAASSSKKVIDKLKAHTVSGIIKASFDPVMKTIKSMLSSFGEKLFSGELLKKVSA